jgi:hypothetical protein
MPTKTILPKKWPKELTYLDAPTYSLAITSSLKKALHTPPPNTTILLSPSSPSLLVLIKPITTPTHPAYSQNGLFAARTLPPTTLIITYVGLFHGPKDADPTSSYDLSVDAALGISIDAQRMGNEARFINDFRGVAEKPNAEFRDVWVRAGAEVERRVGVFVMGGKGREKGIRKGDELLVSYGKGFWNARRHEDG